MINEYFLFFMDNKSGWKTNEKRLSKKEPKIYEEVKKFIENNSLNYLPFQQQVWHFINKYTEIPKCAECNKELIFKRSLKEGYGKYCSLSCTNKNKEHIEKSKKTWLGKFEETQKKIKKTNKERYGVENPYQNLELVKNGFIKNHGVEHVSKVGGVLEKRKKTNIDRYGYLNNLNNKEILEKTHEIRRNRFLLKYSDYNFKKHTGNKLTIECNNCQCDYEIDRALFRHRTMYNITPCTICNPINSGESFFEKEVFTFIKSLYNGFIIENDRTLIHPKELDVYIPELNLAIEFDGLYWHSSDYIHKNYHIQKTKACKLKGIDLVHIFEDEWVNKKEIVKSILKAKIKKYDNIIYARKCEIKKINTKEYKKFCQENHIQGPVNAKIKLGLFYKQELVSVMSFGDLRKSLGSKKEFGTYEMLRFCCKLNNMVFGGAAKLFNYFVKNYEPNKIVSFSDERYFNGLIYEKLGFDFIENTKPNYYYITDYLKRENRFKYRKDVLVAEGYDKNKTESQIMEERGIPRIYDCGNKKWVWKSQTHLL